MSSTSDTSAVDDKKTSTTTTSTGAPATFISNLANQLLHLSITILVGGMILYSAKVSQTNLMPTDLNCEPFQRSDIKLDEVQVNVDVVKIKGDTKSTKIVFPYEQNIDIIKNGILGIGYLQNWKEGPNSSPSWIYMATIQQQMYAFFTNMMTSSNALLHQSLPESVIVFLTPFIYILLVFIFGAFTTLYGCIMYFYNIYLLFSTKKECKYIDVLDEKGGFIYMRGENGEQKPLQELRIHWEYKKGAMMSQWYWAIMYFIAAFVFMGFSCGIIIPLLSFMTVLKVLILPLFLVGKVVGSDEDYTFSTSLMHILKYKMSLIMYIVSFFIVVDAFTSLGMLGLLFSILACLFIFCFYPETYKQFIPQDGFSTSGLASYKMAQKFCVAEKFDGGTCEEPAHSFLWQIFKSFFTLFEAVKKPVNEVSELVQAQSQAPAPAPDTKTDLTEKVKPLYGGRTRKHKNT